jgi:hypothetical protein
MRADRPDLGEQVTAVFRPLWPEFIHHDPIDIEYSSRIEGYFPHYDVLVLDGGEVVTTGAGAPLRWDGRRPPRRLLRRAGARRHRARKLGAA